jgi:excisionase family DNA binding protein
LEHGANERDEFTPLASRASRSHRAAPLAPLLTLEQVATLLAVSPKTVRRLVARGFPHIRFGRVLRFAPADVQRWLEARSS